MSQMKYQQRSYSPHLIMESIDVITEGIAILLQNLNVCKVYDWKVANLVPIYK